MTVSASFSDRPWPMLRREHTKALKRDQIESIRANAGQAPPRNKELDHLSPTTHHLRSPRFGHRARIEQFIEA